MTSARTLYDEKVETRGNSLIETIRGRLRRVPVLVWMVLIGMALRVAVIPFDTIEDLMDAEHIHAWEQGNVARALRVIHIGRTNLLPYEQDIYDEKGRVVTQALYENYQEYNGQQFPAKVTISRPLDEYSLQIDVTKLTINDELPDDQFIPPKIQPGMTVKKMN